MHPSIHAYIALHYITYITYIHIRTIPYHTIPYIPYIPYIHACMHTCIHACSSHSRVYRHIYIYTVGCIDIYIYILLFYCIYIYIYIYICVLFPAPYQLLQGCSQKKQRISYSPQKGCNVTHFAMFDWRRVPHSTDSSSCFSLKKSIYNLPNLLNSPENHHTPSAVFHTFP